MAFIHWVNSCKVHICFQCEFKISTKYTQVALFNLTNIYCGGQQHIGDTLFELQNVCFRKTWLKIIQKKFLNVTFEPSLLFD